MWAAFIFTAQGARVALPRLLNPPNKRHFPAVSGCLI